MACCRRLLLQHLKRNNISSQLCKISSCQQRCMYSTELKEVLSPEKEEQLAYLRKSKEIFEQHNYQPLVDLSNTKGITVQHSTRENASSALLRQCLTEEPDREGFFKAVDIYVGKNKKRHRHMEFITTAMKFIEPYDLDKDVEVYNKLLDVFPKDKFVNRTLFDAVWPKQHPQMNLALDILTKMEWQSVLPTEETHEIMYGVFGRASFPLKKIYRMWFWFETLKDINPYLLPDDVFKDRADIIKAGIDRILGDNDGTHFVEVSTGQDNGKMVDYDHFIISSQSEYQKKCTRLLEDDKTLYVEGPLNIWLNHVREEYFVLKTGRQDLVTNEFVKVEPDEEREGVVLGVCFATRPYKDNIAKWLSFLQAENHKLKEVNIVLNINDDSEYPQATLPEH